MCGRYGLYRDPSPFARTLRASVAPGFRFAPHYNVAPTHDVLGVTNAAERRLEELRWGLRVPFTRHDGARLSTINARIETLVTSPLYGPLVPARRCVIFADGYFEWPPDGPVWIAPADGSPIAFAGLFEDAGNGPPTCTIVTRPPEPALSRTHDRMPACLDVAVADAWLRPGPIDPAAALTILETQAAREWLVRRVGRAVGDVRRDDATLLEPSSEPQQQSLF